MAPTSSDGKEISYIIDSIKYTAKFSLSDILYLCASNEFVNFRKYTSEKITNFTFGEDKPSAEAIEKQPDNFFQEIFDCFLCDNTEFYTLYSQCEVSEICECYTLTYLRYLLNTSIDSAVQISQSINTALLDVAEKTSSLIQNVNFDFLQSFAEKINSVISLYADNASKIIGAFSFTLDSFAKISEYLLSDISDLISSIGISKYSKAEKKRLINVYKQWGKFGWTIPPNSCIDSFNNCPETLLKADKYALRFCTRNEMNELFLALESLCKRKRDVREAVKCYNNKHYKACALILFSLIDSRIIRLQGKSGKYGVGIGAVANFKEVAKEKTTDEGKLFLALCYENIFSCLFAMFEDTNNFTKEQNIINRNYLDHGMSCKIVRKKDCIKLFLLLYNMLEFIYIIK